LAGKLPSLGHVPAHATMTEASPRLNAGTGILTLFYDSPDRENADWRGSPVSARASRETRAPASAPSPVADSRASAPDTPDFQRHPARDCPGPCCEIRRGVWRQRTTPSAPSSRSPVRTHNQRRTRVLTDRRPPRIATYRPLPISDRCSRAAGTVVSPLPRRAARAP